MKNEEMKKKIVDTMHPILKGTRVSCNEENACKQCWFPCEVDRLADSLADALIAAGIGDVSELKKHRVVVEKSLIPEDDNAYVLPNIPPTVKQLYSGEEVEDIARQRDEYKRRAEVAERALKIAEDLGELCAPAEDYIKQAEKELAEEAI